MARGRKQRNLKGSNTNLNKKRKIVIDRSRSGRSVVSGTTVTNQPKVITRSRSGIKQTRQAKRKAIDKLNVWTNIVQPKRTKMQNENGENSQMANRTNTKQKQTNDKFVKPKALCSNNNATMGHKSMKNVRETFIKRNKAIAKKRCAKSKDVIDDVNYSSVNFSDLNDGVDLSVSNMSDFENEDEEEVVSEYSDDEEQTVQEPQPSTSGLAGTRQQEVNEEELIRSNPALMKLMDKMMNQKLKELGRTTANKPEENCNTGKKGEIGATTDTRNKRSNIKSPSDTTIYAPALGRQLMRNSPNGDRGVVMPYLQSQINAEQEIRNNVTPVRQVQNCGDMRQRNIYSDICDIVDKAREEDDDRRRVVSSDIEIPGHQEAKDRMERSIIEAEKFKATVEKPPGRFSDTDTDFQSSLDKLARKQIGTGLTDDDFFHLTCHIDPQLQSKIERGEFVELDKLLPKDKNNYGRSDDNRLEWVHKDGCTYLAPVNKDNKINSIRKWEQAFRIYATIYCGANPNRGKEVWQYISVINTAATSYIWDNVYNYDVTFRHLMQFNPDRNWAVTYNQMWNLCMRDPIPKNFQNKNGGNRFSAGGSSNASASYNGSHVPQSGNKKRQHCWSFNKGVKCKFGKNCRYIERCSYCDSSSHGVHICPKLDRKEGSSTPATAKRSDSSKYSRNSHE